jgi:hypothetical protein
MPRPRGPPGAGGPGARNLSSVRNAHTRAGVGPSLGVGGGGVDSARLRVYMKSEKANMLTGNIHQRHILSSWKRGTGAGAQQQAGCLYFLPEK